MDTVLVVEDDARLRQFIQVHLRLDGFTVLEAGEGKAGLRLAAEYRPDLILLDIGLPDIDGLTVCRRLRAEVETCQIPIIFVTGRQDLLDRIAGLAAGADDYVAKPFDPLELVARVRNTLERCRSLRDTSPLTGLPGNHAIHAELAARITARRPVAVGYADLNHFKSYNDRYGFARGDEVILLTAELALRALRTHTLDDGFLGHIGGDDFLLVCGYDPMEDVCEQLLADFDREMPRLYDEPERSRGWLDLPDRRGDVQRFPLVSLAIGVATNRHREVTDHRELLTIASEMKRYVKLSKPGSAYAVDERRQEVAQNVT